MNINEPCSIANRQIIRGYPSWFFLFTWYHRRCYFLGTKSLAKTTPSECDKPISMRMDEESLLKLLLDHQFGWLWLAIWWPISANWMLVCPILKWESATSKTWYESFTVTNFMIGKLASGWKTNDSFPRYMTNSGIQGTESCNPVITYSNTQNKCRKVFPRW